MSDEFYGKQNLIDLLPKALVVIYLFLYSYQAENIMKYNIKRNQISSQARMTNFKLNHKK